MDRVECIKDTLTKEVGRTRAILRGLQLIQQEETANACMSNDLGYLIELASEHIALADAMTNRLDEALVRQHCEEVPPCP